MISGRVYSITLNKPMFFFTWIETNYSVFTSVLFIQFHQHTRRIQTEQVSHLWKEPMTHDRRTVSNFGKEAQAQDRGTKIAGVPVDCIIGSAWTFFHWNYRTLASQDSQQWLTTTTPPTLQPNTRLTQLAWEGQRGRKLRPSFPCTWQYVL